MRQIPLSNGRDFAVVSDEEFSVLSAFRWHRHTAGYAYRAVKKAGKQTNYLMHRDVLGAKSGQIVDHINGDPLDNRRQNLRFATHSQNCMNAAAIRKTSDFRGVSWHSCRKKWRAVIKRDGRAKHIGYFASETQAAAAYDRAAAVMHGEFARTNGVGA